MLGIQIAIGVCMPFYINIHKILQKPTNTLEKQPKICYNIDCKIIFSGDKEMSNNIDLSDRWYSTKEICAYLGISRDTLLVWIASKNMPAHKVGRNWKFKVSEVDEWIKSGKAAE